MTTAPDSQSSLRPLSYTEYEPDPLLSKYILCGWSFEAESSMPGTFFHHVLPDGCVSVLYRTDGHSPSGALILSGPRTRALQVPIQAGDRFWGIRFWPDAARPCLGIDPRALRDRSEWMAAHVAMDVNLWITRLGVCDNALSAIDALQDFLRQSKTMCVELDQEVRQCLIEINRSEGTGSISDILESFPVSPRQMQRRFRDCVGLTPKEYARVRRLRVALAKALDPNAKGWGGIAFQAGFSDQAHLTRESAAMTGLSPMQFEARIKHIDHKNVDP